MPFDYKNPIGYSLTIFIQVLFTYNAMRSSVCIMAFSMGSFLMLLSSTEDAKVELRAINPSATLIKRNPFQVSQKMSEFVRFHSNLLQLRGFDTN